MEPSNDRNSQIEQRVVPLGLSAGLCKLLDTLISSANTLALEMKVELGPFSPALRKHYKEAKNYRELLRRELVIVCSFGAAKGDTAAGRKFLEPAHNLSRKIEDELIPLLAQVEQTLPPEAANEPETVQTADSIRKALHKAQEICLQIAKEAEELLNNILKLLDKQIDQISKRKNRRAKKNKVPITRKKSRRRKKRR